MFIAMNHYDNRKKNNKQNQVRNIKLIYPGEFFLDKNLSKNGKHGLDFGQCSIEFPIPNLCYNHEFAYQEETSFYTNVSEDQKSEVKAEESVNVKPDVYYLNWRDSATFYLYGGFYSPNSPVDEWQQSYFAVVRNDNKKIPFSISLILKLIPVPLESDPIITGDKYSRNIFGDVLPACQYKKIM